MDDSQFIHVKSLEGELLYTQKRKRLGCTLTTKELIIQQPHTTYHMLLDDIIGIIPFQLENTSRPIGIVGETEIVTRFPRQYYKVAVRELYVIKRNGILQRNDAHLIVPFNRRFMDKMAEHSGLTVLPV